jgi:hypothetical protein
MLQAVAGIDQGNGAIFEAWEAIDPLHMMHVLHGSTVDVDESGVVDIAAAQVQTKVGAGGAGRSGGIPGQKLPLRSRHSRRPPQAR